MRRRERDIVTPAGKVPRPLLVGPLIEIWTDDDNVLNARRNFVDARDAWFERQHVTDAAMQCQLVPRQTPWSAAYLVEAGRESDVGERLARANCTIDDLPSLTREARNLRARTPANPYRRTDV